MTAVSVVPETVTMSGEALVNLLALVEDFHDEMCKDGCYPYPPFEAASSAAWGVAYDTFGISQYDDVAGDYKDSTLYENHPIVAEIADRDAESARHIRETGQLP